MPRLVAFCLICAITVGFGNAIRPQDRVFAQLPILKQMYDKVLKTVSGEATLNDAEFRRLQASANNFQLYIQEGIYVLNRAAEKVADPSYKTQFGALLDIAHVGTYEIGKIINGNSTRMRPVIQNTIESYIDMFQPAKALFELPEHEKMQFALKFAEEVYNLGAFNICLIYAELEYRKKTNLQIGNQIRFILDEASVMLEKIDVVDFSLTRELVTLMRFLGHLMDRIVYRAERWAYLYNIKNQQVEAIANVTQNLAKDAWSLRKSARASETTFYLRQILEGLLNNISKEIKKLAELNTDGLRQENDICKDVLLEYLTVVYMLSMELQVLIASKNN